MAKVGVIGLGTVGGVLLDALSMANVESIGYDPHLDVGAPGSLSGCSPVFVCVPTPAGDDGALDASAVWKAVGDVEADLADRAVVAIKSTVPPGTSDALTDDFPRLEFASVPEFLVSAHPLETLTRPDRVLIGARSAEVFERVRAVMSAVAPGAPVLFLQPREAELAKLAANAMLAAKVSLANELALICERFGVEWTSIQAAVGLDHRIGLDHLTVTPERGFSGGCLPKDLEGLIEAAHESGYASPLLQAVRDFNRTVHELTRNTEGAAQ
jgi:UDPglucose 6-dehydrogenase